MKKILYVLIALFLLGVAGLFYLGQKSQEGDAPGLVDGSMAPCPASPNCVSSETETAGEQKVEPLPVTVWEDVPAIVADLGGAVIIQDEDYIAAEFPESIFHFVDDVEFRLAEDAVHVRSASRVGQSDFGVNKARVEDIRKALDQ